MSSPHHLVCHAISDPVRQATATPRAWAPTARASPRRSKRPLPTASTSRSGPGVPASPRSTRRCRCRPNRGHTLRLHRDGTELHTITHTEARRILPLYMQHSSDRPSPSPCHAHRLTHLLVFVPSYSLGGLPGSFEDRVPGRVPPPDHLPRRPTHTTAAGGRLTHATLYIMYHVCIYIVVSV